MKKTYINISLVAGFLLLLFGCTKDISQYNEQTKRPASVPAAPLFTNAVVTLCNGLVSADGGTNIFRHVVKHWAQSVIQDAAQYNFTIGNVPDNWWTRMYRDVLSDLNQADTIISADNTLLPAVKANQRAIVDIVEVYTFNVLVNSFGNIPYSEALDYDNLFPKYDDAKTITLDLINRLSKDIGQMDASSTGFGSTEDLFYQGNVSRWIAFAASLEEMIAMTIADVDDATAKATVEAADSKSISSTDGDAVLQYYASVPNNNPLYNSLVLAGRTDYIAAVDLMTPLLNMSDPRLPAFFGTNNSGDYKGAVVGVATDFASCSKPSSRIQAPDAPFVLLDYMEIEFYRAEAIERGYKITGTAEQHYNNAISASIFYWGGTQDDVKKYLGRPDVVYTTAEGGWREKIGFQKWIALYNRPFDGWTELRRLDYPQMSLAVGAVSGFPNRMAYPNTTYSEQTLNGDNYQQAAQAIGGDKVETKLFWDIN